MSNIYSLHRLGKVGRLGNQLWQIAATVSMARGDPGSEIAIPPTWEYRPLVCLPEEFYRDSPPSAIDAMRQAGGPYFQHLCDIKHVTVEELREWFGPSVRGIDRMAELHREPLMALMDVKHATAIHVRRGDYLNHPDSFPPLTEAYYTEAARCAPAETRFFVFSDDVEWCRNNRRFLGVADRDAIFVDGRVVPVELSERVGEPADIFDLWLMSRCDAHIIANSTFSWWGAFLSRQRNVIYPSLWFGPKCPGYDRMFECIPEGWTRLRC